MFVKVLINTKNYLYKTSRQLYNKLVCMKDYAGNNEKLHCCTPLCLYNITPHYVILRYIMWDTMMNKKIFLHYKRKLRPNFVDLEQTHVLTSKSV